MSCIYFIYFPFVHHWTISRTRPALTNKLIKQDLQHSQFKSSFLRFYDWSYNAIARKYNLLLGRILNDVFHTYYQAIINHWIVNGFYRFPDFDKEQTASVTCQQGMLTYPWHLILVLKFVEVSVCSFPILYFSFGLLKLNGFKTNMTYGRKPYKWILDDASKDKTTRLSIRSTRSRSRHVTPIVESNFLSIWFANADISISFRNQYML